MKTVYVIAIKHLFDYKENILDRWEYLYIDNSSGGYTFWDKNVEGAKHFYSIDKLEDYLNEYGYRLLFYGMDKNEYDLDSLCVKKVIFQDPLVNFEKNLPFKEM